MAKFVVLTDSACDLPQELAQKHHIDIVCFKIALDGEGYTERVDFDGKAQFEFFDRFEQYDREGAEQVLYVSINAGGSGTIAAAHAAAAQFHEEHPDSTMRISIVDSHCYSMAYGALVVKASEMLEGGASMDEVVACL